jgi:TonB-dependent receptor
MWSAPVGVVAGRVLDASTGEALPGANVRVEGTSIGSATNADGRYTIANVPSGTVTLVATFIGYEQQEQVVEVPDGGRVEADFELVYQTIEGEGVVVTAQVAGQLAAINEQFSNSTVGNVVSGARIQELPDNNAAESIGRLPGVSIQRSGGEAQRVAIRGLSPRFNNVTVNGVRLPGTDEGNRAVDLSLVSSNILDGIDVRKAITPDMDADVVGGTIDLRLRSAPSEPVIDLQAQGGYTGLQEDFGNYKFVGTASNRFLDDRLGAIATFNAQRYDRSADKLDVGYAYSGDNPLTPGGEADPAIRIDSYELREELVDRSRAGGSLLLDWRLPGGRILGNAFYNRLNNDGLYRFFGPNTDVLSYNVEDREASTSILTSSLQVEQGLGFLEYDVQAAFTRSRSRNPEDYVWRFANEASAFTEGTDTLFATSPLEGFQTVAADSTAPLADLWVDSRELDEDQYSLELNVQAPFRMGERFGGMFDWLSGYIKAGGKLRWLDRTYDQERMGRQGLQYPGFWDDVTSECVRSQLGEGWDPDLVGGQNISLPINQVLLDYSREDDFLEGDYSLGLVPDRDRLMELTRAFQSSACANIVNEEGIPTVYVRNSLESIGQDYRGEERYQAGYVMGRFDIGKYVTVIPGVRYERDQADYTGQRFRESFTEGTLDEPPALLDTLNVERENAYWLPMVHVDIRPQDWLSIRLARTETIARPDYNQYAPITSINGDFNYIRAANTGLRPQTAVNYDASVQFVNRNLGLVGVSAFHKTIDELVLTIETPTRGLVVGGDTTIIGVPEEANIPYQWLAQSPLLQTSINVEDPTTFYGFELEWQASFSFLPGALRGLILNVNYTRAFSETTYSTFRIERGDLISFPPPVYEYTYEDTTRTGRMPDQSAHIANVTVGWDYKGFSARVSYLYQSNTASYINPQQPLLDTYVGDYSRFDVSLRQKLFEGFEVYTNLNNINNRPDRNFTGQPPGGSFNDNYPSYRELYGYTIDVGARYRF